ncbi:MAG: hypothetical protein Q9165_000268 [Trypethelium subeluteriae]
MAAYINLCLQGAVYFAAHRSAEDHAMLQLYSNTLIGLPRDGEKVLMDVESTFDGLYSRVAQDWHQQDDVVTTFNDRRWSHVGAVWTFDLDGDILRLDKRDRKFWVPLNLVRQRVITISDFEPYEVPSTLAKHALQSVYPVPCWKMRRKEIDLQRLQRHKAFVSRILADFAFQWRHVLCGRYNNSTFRRLAYAIVRIITLDFTVEEVTLSRQGTGGFLVWIGSLPEWGFASGHIVRVGGTSILILYRINSELERYTEPKRLFDGTHPPSDEAIELLLQATQTSATTAPLRKLPVELQDAILDEVSEGPMESARIGCLLDAGFHQSRIPLTNEQKPRKNSVRRSSDPPTGLHERHRVILDMSTPGYYVAGIVNEVHPSPSPAKMGPFEPVKLHMGPNLNHSVAILGFVPISFEMVVKMIFCGFPSLSQLLEFHEHGFVLVQGSAGPSRNLKEAEVGPGVHRNRLLDDRIPFTRGEDEAKDVPNRPSENE